MGENTHMRSWAQMRLYQGAYAELWMTFTDLGTSPEFSIIDSDTGETVYIEGTNWKDLRDVMDSLKIYEYEKMEEAI